MEITTIDNLTFDYLKDLTIDSMFQKSIQYPCQKLPLPPSKEGKIEVEKDKFTISESEIPNFTFEKGVGVGCIKAFNNILVICGGSLLKSYDVDLSYEPVNTFRFPQNKKLNTLALTTSKDEEDIYCVVAGDVPVIYAINLLEGKELNHFIGHRNEIYDLVFHPKKKEILLSSSKDCTVRLWNILKGEQISIFGGPDSHQAEVLSVDWHCEGSLFVSGSVDNCIKIYEINEAIEEKIQLSLEGKKKVKTHIKNKPLFSCSEVHNNYVDCVKFNGNFIISKSVDGIIKEWLPMFDEERNYYFLINTYIYKVTEKIFYIKFFFDLHLSKIIIANELGTGFVFNINSTEKFETNDYYHFSNTPSVTVQIKQGVLFRAVEYSSMYSKVYFGGENGEVNMFNLN